VRDWKTLARRVTYAKPPWLEVATEKVQLPDGRVLDEYLRLRGRDFAMIVPVTSAGDLVLIRSYKHGPRRVSLSCPAGYIEQGEDPMAAAQRELLEETGYEAARIERLGSFVIDGNWGLATEHAFIAFDVRKVREPASGDHEEIAVELHPRGAWRSLVESGEIVQLAAVAALGLAFAGK
jgi:ADP-ribose pyrophosphatase